MDILPCSPEQWAENEENFLKQLENNSVWDKIPLLNVNEMYHLKDGILVRFRGMIQDMHGPECYLEKFEITNRETNEKYSKLGKYRDAAITSANEYVDLDSEVNVTMERQTYVVISVPGINDWVQVAEAERYKLCTNAELASSNQTKRSYETMDLDGISEAEQSTSSSDIQKKNRTEWISVQNSNLQALSKEYLLNFPLPNRTGKTCHLKVYRNDELKLNDICEFVGFLAIDLLVDATYQNQDEDIYNIKEREILHPPSSLVPRIHCVSFRRLKHNNPLINSDCNKIDLERLNFIRKELLLVLTQLLLGDELAAEYLLFHLISEVYLRRDFMPLGKFSLNISNVPKFDNIDYAAELYKFIEQLVPKSYYLPMTLENMNSLSFIPKKDYECNRLTSGILQLSGNTHLVLDETKLCPGKLNAVGVNNLKAIANAIKYQKVTYDFNYYPLDFDCDIPFLILSEGKSMITVDTQVILKTEVVCMDTFAEIIQAAKHFLKPDLLNDIRKYLTLARLTKYEISDNVEELVQNEFVRMRQGGTVTADDLHSLLVLARLVCISQGNTTLDEECWKKACSLERERKARLAK